MRFSKSLGTFFTVLLLTACVNSGNHAPDSTHTLYGEEWLVEDIASRGVIDFARTTMLFGPNGQLSGNTSCNRYFGSYQKDGLNLQIEPAGSTKRACPPAVMDQERRFLVVLSQVQSFRLDPTNALMLTTASGVSMTARQISDIAPTATYHCDDGSQIAVWYPTTTTAKIIYQDRMIELTSVVSASGARYVGGGLQWWTKERRAGQLSPLAENESIATAKGVSCTRR